MQKETKKCKKQKKHKKKISSFYKNKTMETETVIFAFCVVTFEPIRI